eukprot:483637-Hanusia_phi.AAC.3
MTRCRCAVPWPLAAGLSDYSHCEYRTVLPRYAVRPTVPVTRPAGTVLSTGPGPVSPPGP